MIDIQQTGNSLELVKSGTISHAAHFLILNEEELTVIRKLIITAFNEGRKAAAISDKGK